MNIADEKPFLMSIEDTFVLKGRGIVVTGRIQQGVARKGDAVEIGYPGKPILNTAIAGIAWFDPFPFQEVPSDITGLLLRGVEEGQIKPGMLLAAPGVLASLSENAE